MNGELLESKINTLVNARLVPKAWEYKRFEQPTRELFLDRIETFSHYDDEAKCLHVTFVMIWKNESYQYPNVNVDPDGINCHVFMAAELLVYREMKLPTKAVLCHYTHPTEYYINDRWIKIAKYYRSKKPVVPQKNQVGKNILIAALTGLLAGVSYVAFRRK